MQMFDSRANILNKPDCHLLSLSLPLYLQKVFEISSCHKLHNDGQLVLLGDVDRDHLHNLRVVRFSSKIRTNLRFVLRFLVEMH